MANINQVESEALAHKWLGRADKNGYKILKRANKR